MVRLCITHLLGIRSRIDQLVSERPGHTKGLAPRRCLGRRDWVEYLGVSVNQRTRCDLNLDLALKTNRIARGNGLSARQRNFIRCRIYRCHLDGAHHTIH